MIYKIEDINKKEEIASKILNNLPEWFGIPESTQEYIDRSKDYPFWAEIDNNIIKGFISLKETSKYTAELYVMGVLKEFHRNKIGYNLFKAFYEYAKEHQYQYIQVKTVKENCYEDYDRTIAFYKKMGFSKLEVFPTLWDPWNPCLVMIKSLK